MTAYSVADAKNNLPKLIDKALRGEEVVITRHGRAVAEIRPTPTAGVDPSPNSYERLRLRRAARPPISITSVELLDRMYDDSETL